MVCWLLLEVGFDQWEIPLELTSLCRGCSGGCSARLPRHHPSQAHVLKPLWHKQMSIGGGVGIVGAWMMDGQKLEAFPALAFLEMNMEAAMASSF